jgi:CheY-like chemotaxis protein
VRVQVATLTAVRDAIQHAYHLEDALNAYLDGVPPATDTPVAELEEASDLSTLVRGTQLPPVVKLLNLILVDGVRAGASDVHIEASLSEVRVRYRIDGVLHESFRLPKWVEDPLTARCKVLASLDITERRLPQDGRIRIRYQEKMFDVRVSSLPTQFGEKVTMRILDPNSGPKSLESLNLQSRDRSEPEITYVAKPVPQPRPRPSVEANRPIEVARTLETPPIEAPRVVETPPAAPQAAPLSEGEGAANGSRRFRALIIDDERDFRYLVKVFLEHSGIPIEVEMASNGREGIDKARANLPDIVLLDIMMPEMDGFEVCKMLRADVHTAFVPILMLTALDDSASRTRGFMAGTDDYISKPFDRRELLARFRRVLGRTYGVGMPEGTPREDTENLTAEPMEEAPAL